MIKLVLQMGEVHVDIRSVASLDETFTVFLGKNGPPCFVLFYFVPVFLNYVSRLYAYQKRQYFL